MYSLHDHHHLQKSIAQSSSFLCNFSFYYNHNYNIVVESLIATQKMMHPILLLPSSYLVKGKCMVRWFKKQQEFLNLKIHFLHMFFNLKKLFVIK